MNPGGKLCTNGSSPVDKFEESFQGCVSALTKEDTLTNVDKDEIKIDVEHAIQNFLENARSMEAYFLRKRLHIAAQKPELILKDDANELKFEVVRKDELLRKNYEKINYWQSMLADLQTTSSTSGSSTAASSTAGSGPATPTTMGRPTPPPSGMSQVGRPTSLGSPAGRGSGYPSPAGPQPPSSSGLQGPLAFLEKTASGIGSNDSR